METPFRTESERRSERPNGPEWFANPPLENTSLVYSVPFRGEWDNGQVLRYLHAQLSENVAKGEAFELNLIANYGHPGSYLDPRRQEDHAGDERFQQEKAALLDKMRQTDEAAAFMRTLVELQGYARRAMAAEDEGAKQAIREIVFANEDPVERDIMLLAIRRAGEVSIALLDLTKMDIGKSPYEYLSLAVARTIGMDCATLRFEHNPDVAVSMSDVDTVPLDAHTVSEIQRTYVQNPKIDYVFLGMSDQAKGISSKLASHPTMARHLSYNQYPQHGSPQITFRLRAYAKIKEICCQLIYGDMDRDTAARLVYHFGDLQEGLLFDVSRTIPASPRVLTADRIDGYNDGNGDRFGHRERKAYGIENDLRDIRKFQQELQGLIADLPMEKAEEARTVLSAAREKELQREHLQQRMNRLVVNAFFKAIELGWIYAEAGTTRIDEARLTELQGGKALQLFLRVNPVIVSELLASPTDLAMLRYYAGADVPYPSEVVEPTYLQRAFRDYLGESVSFQELMSGGECVEGPAEHGFTTFIDQRAMRSRTSFWHGMTAELLALGHTYRLFFQTKEFMGTRSKSNWPAAAGGPEGHFKFRPIEERMSWLRGLDAETHVPSVPANAPAPKTAAAPVDTPKHWSDRFSFRSIPGYALAKRLFWD